MKKSQLTQRGKSSSTWRNNNPPLKQHLGTVKMTVPIAIPVGKILFGAVLLLIIWSLL